MSNTVHIFWDNSNIFIPAQYVANKREGPAAEFEVRIQFDRLYDLARAGRKVETAYCVGSVPPELKAIWDRLRTVGIEVEVLERGSSTGTEQGVDQSLQVHMLRVTLDYKSDPGIAVLLTGDGKGYDTGIGYHADLERMQKQGWGIEVLSWDAACRSALKEWAARVGAYVKLDDYYDSITFIQGGRRSIPLSLA